MNFKILTEGGNKIGIGHISRCISLYQVFIENGHNAQLIINGDESIYENLIGIDNILINWMEEFDTVSKQLFQSDIIIIDSYLCSEKICEAISRKVKLSVFLDDFMRINYPKGIIINGALYANNLNYLKTPKYQYLLGAKYACLRKEFRNIIYKNINLNIESVVVTFGGGDNIYLNQLALNILNKELPKAKKTIIIGNKSLDISSLHKLSDKNTVILHKVTATEMKQIMTDSDIALSAGGQTAYELCRVGTPFVAIETANNQRYNLEALHKLDVINKPLKFSDIHIENNIVDYLRFLKDFRHRDDIRMKMIRIIDGKGPERIFKSIEKTYNE
jgi:UDP-2,4-diacetamido-2,4,6-trideoxy-beta-L-altropyranose hydrolase